MKSLFRCLVLMGVFGILQGCAAFQSSDEPVATAPPSEVYYDQFTDIPIPSDMKIDRENTLITTAQDGVKVGLMTVTGRVEIASLNNAMIHNMARQGWALRAVTTGMRTMQIYEKGMQYTVIYTYENMFSTRMEIWGAHKLGDGAYQNIMSNPPMSSSFTLGPSNGGDSFDEQGLAY